jgi:hypothetical protein
MSEWKACDQFAWAAPDGLLGVRHVMCGRPSASVDFVIADHVPKVQMQVDACAGTLLRPDSASHCNTDVDRVVIAATGMLVLMESATWALLLRPLVVGRDRDCAADRCLGTRVPLFRTPCLGIARNYSSCDWLLTLHSRRAGLELQVTPVTSVWVMTV